MNWHNFFRALLGVAGVGLVLIPAGPIRAQTPTTLATRDEKKIERKDKNATAEEREAELRGAREEVERIQEEMQKLRKQLQKRSEDMQKAMQRVQQLEAEPGRITLPQGNVDRFRPGWGGPSQDERLNQVEQKLEAILKELGDLRSDRQAPIPGNKGNSTPAPTPPNILGPAIQRNPPVPVLPLPPIADPARPEESACCSNRGTDLVPSPIMASRRSGWRWDTSNPEFTGVSAVFQKA